MQAWHGEGRPRRRAGGALTLYAESSAVLRWILAQDRGDAIRGSLAGATRVVTSVLTLIECSRSVPRAVMEGRMAAGQESASLELLAAASTRWQIYDLAPEIVERARMPFPKEPVRTLDAIHLATMLALRDGAPALRILSVDDRIRENAALLGFPLVPGR